MLIFFKTIYNFVESFSRFKCVFILLLDRLKETVEYGHKFLLFILVK